MQLCSYAVMRLGPQEFVRGEEPLAEEASRNQDDPPQEVAPVPPNDKPVSKPQILIADDEEDMRDLLCALLEDGGYQVIEARDGRETVELLRKSKEPLLVLLDLNMPKVNGMEVLQEVSDRDAFWSRIDLSSFLGSIRVCR